MFFVFFLFLIYFYFPIIFFFQILSKFIKKEQLSLYIWPIFAYIRIMGFLFKFCLSFFAWSSFVSLDDSLFCTVIFRFAWRFFVLYGTVFALSLFIGHISDCLHSIALLISHSFFLSLLLVLYLFLHLYLH